MPLFSVDGSRSTGSTAAALRSLLQLCTASLQLAALASKVHKSPAQQPQVKQCYDGFISPGNVDESMAAGRSLRDDLPQLSSIQYRSSTGLCNFPCLIKFD